MKLSDNAIFAGAMALGLSMAAPAAAEPFLVDFNTAPFTGFVTNFQAGGFSFVFESDGDGGDFVFSGTGGEGGTGAIDALSGSLELGTTETISIVRSAGGTFDFDRLWTNNLNTPGTVDYVALLGGTQIAGGAIAGGIGAIVEPSIEIDVLQIVGTDINLLFDSFEGSLAMDTDPDLEIPAPATLALLGFGLIGAAAVRRGRSRTRR